MELLSLPWGPKFYKSHTLPKLSCLFSKLISFRLKKLSCNLKFQILVSKNRFFAIFIFGSRKFHVVLFTLCDVCFDNFRGNFDLFFLFLNVGMSFEDQTLAFSTNVFIFSMLLFFFRCNHLARAPDALQ